MLCKEKLGLHSYLTLDLFWSLPKSWIHYPIIHCKKLDLITSSNKCHLTIYSIVRECLNSCFFNLKKNFALLDWVKCVSFLLRSLKFLWIKSVLFRVNEKKSYSLVLCIEILLPNPFYLPLLIHCFKLPKEFYKPTYTYTLSWIPSLQHVYVENIEWKFLSST